MHSAREVVKNGEWGITNDLEHGKGHVESADGEGGAQRGLVQPLVAVDRLDGGLPVPEEHGCRAPLGLLKPGTHARSALRAATSERGPAARLAVDRQLTRATASGLGGGGDAELLFDLDAPTPGAVSQVAGGSDQGLEGMVAGHTVVFIEWHTWNDSSGSGIGGLACGNNARRAGVVGARRATIGILEGEPKVVNAGRIELTGGAITG